MMLLGKARLVEALQKAAKSSPADQTLLAAQRSSQTTLRFASGQIYQNLHEEDLTIWIKVACGPRSGVATTSSFKQEALAKAVESAVAIAHLSGRQIPPSFSSAPSPEPTPAVETFFPETVRRSLEKTVREILDWSERSRKSGMTLAGSIVLGEHELSVAGSRGLVRYQPFTSGGLRLVATRNGASGFAAQSFRDIAEMDAETLLESAWTTCRMNRNPKAIPLGKYDVLLEPEAVAEILEWLGTIGFGAKQLAERTSFLTGRMGEKLMSSKISIVDDGSDPAGLAVPFDLEGVPKQRVALIDQGRAAGVVYDSHYAKLAHRRSTGHALPYDEFEGPLPTNLALEAGSSSREQLFKKLDNGLWIRRFHYVNGLLDTHEALMTGLTRDGTFRIRNGKVAGAVKNLRFTQSMLEAFSKVAALSKERRRVGDPAQGFSSVVTPAVLIRDFTFTGQTK